jgi:hypothetical protein
MKAILKLEAIGDDACAISDLFRNMADEAVPGLGTATFGHMPRPWVADILGPDPTYTYRRRFVRAKKDYSKANSKGSRGVYLWYVLESGHVYEVNERKTWSTTERYFVRVADDGGIVRVPAEEVATWYPR